MCEESVLLITPKQKEKNMKVKIKAIAKTLPLPPAYASLHKESGDKQEKPNEEQATQETPGEKPDDGQETPQKRDWSKVNRGINSGSYGRPVFWNEDRLRVLKDLRDQGKSYAEIAEEFGKTPEACRRQWYKASGY